MTCCQCKLKALIAYVGPITVHQGMISSLLAPSRESGDIVATGLWFADDMHDNFT